MKFLRYSLTTGLSGRPIRVIWQWHSQIKIWLTSDQLSIVIFSSWASKTFRMRCSITKSNQMTYLRVKYNYKILCNQNRLLITTSLVSMIHSYSCKMNQKATNSWNNEEWRASHIWLNKSRQTLHSLITSTIFTGWEPVDQTNNKKCHLIDAKRQMFENINYLIWYTAITKTRHYKPIKMSQITKTTNKLTHSNGKLRPRQKQRII